MHMEVLVFKTNLRFKKQINAVTPLIDTMQGILKWNVDLYDKDKILRIESRAGGAWHHAATVAACGRNRCGGP